MREMVIPDCRSSQCSSASCNAVIPSTMAVLLFSRLLLVSCAFAQSVAPALPSSNSCVKRSIIVYTSDSSTYLVTDVGTSSFPSIPSLCANASVSTVVTTQLASTVTIYSQAAFALTSCVEASAFTLTTTQQASAVTIYSQATLTQASCTNASISTIVATQPASTVTVYSQATPAQQSATPVDPVLANNSFEDVAASPFNFSASSTSITAEVAQNGIYEPHSGDSYL